MERLGKPYKAIVLLHSINEKEFEIESIGFIDEMDKFEKKYQKANGEEKEFFAHKLIDIDAIRDMIAEEVGEYGETIKEIHKDLWDKNQLERFYCVTINLWFETTRDYFGEYDVEVDYEYELSNISSQWQYLDLYQKGSKIYYIDYEESGKAYTIVSIFDVYDNEFQETGIWYNIHADNLPNATGYYPLLSNIIDNENMDSRFFSSPELAHKAYEKFKNKTK